jgi:hypothetical protein
VWADGPQPWAARVTVVDQGLQSASGLTVRGLSQREAADYYKIMGCGYVVATIKEAFAVAPGASVVRVVAVRTAGVTAYGVPRPEALVAARFARAALVGVQWAAADSQTIVNDTSTELVIRPPGAVTTCCHST